MRSQRVLGNIGVLIPSVMALRETAMTAPLGQQGEPFALVRHACAAHPLRLPPEGVCFRGIGPLISSEILLKISKRGLKSQQSCATMKQKKGQFVPDSERAAVRMGWRQKRQIGK